MIKEKYSVIGVMSGTSLDGVDLAHITFIKGIVWRFTINTSQTIAYSKVWFDKLKTVTHKTLAELDQLDIEYSAFLAQTIKQFITRHNITQIDAVCSHGHTALHQPLNGVTYQIGNLECISDILDSIVVCDFRIQDVQLGGQGAPLVPIGDKLLFSEYDYCINLGGFANVSTTIEKERIAFDICPANNVLNEYVRTLGRDFDNAGKIAQSGTLNETLLKQLNALEFYAQTYPKSLGVEWTEANIYPLIDSFNLPIKDILKTMVEHIAIQISRVINTTKTPSVLITGGGVYNTYLLSRIEHLSATKITVPEPKIIEFKEALIFGFLGVLRLRNEINCLKSVTGAGRDHSSGKIYTPQNQQIC
ncbi:anhydro-N-acetylmuramic acid kinase [Bizionia gelidisalsuginis]|uniref:Anhydro-N-acetylmuramic acid kinase n=2 Tax=Bizionia TaxID=283785 RepID=A0A8H2LM84_9FLAO|nr:MULTISPECIES: anhydro-N-acetylmuramic acid kinase [Bizionia]TYB74380.1 anhydro-N-acetylmuramic acid kinase [Bizionia saleffrena]TYC16177.1 anhydro-N-acetylmuramic acid kinase [Bizionia gelidisalsuginis]